MKKIVLAALNAKYIHSNLALRYLSRFQDNHNKHHIINREFTINQRPDFIVEELFRLQPDVVLFSAYIWNVETLRESVGVVPQKAVLFKGTLRQNLQWGKLDATDEELLEALKIAQAENVVESKGGLDAMVEQGGANFSGGQRQRLTIARALVRKPRILILDDSASALDYATDAELRMAIRRMEDPPLTFIVSQRAASVRFADQILVLDDGVLVGKGTHEQLLEECEIYQEIYYSQFPREVSGNV